MSLRGTPIEEFNQELSDDELRDVQSNNWSSLRRALNLTGVREVAKAKLSAAVSTTGANPAAQVLGLSKAFQSSGGFVEICLTTTAHITTSGGVHLYLDGNLVDSFNVSATTASQVTLRHAASLPKGPHRVDVRAYSTGGTAVVVSYANSITQLTVKETLL